MEILIVDLWLMIRGGPTGHYQNFTGTPEPSNLKNILQQLLGSMPLTDICLALPQLAFVISKCSYGYLESYNSLPKHKKHPVSNS